MTNCWIGASNIIDQAVITSADADPSLVPEMLKSPQISLYARFLSPTAVIDFDFGGSVDFDVFAFAQPHLGPLMSGASDTVRWALGTSAGASDIYDSGAISADVDSRFGYHVHQLAATQTGRYLRLTLGAASLSGIGSVDIGRIYAGPVHRFDINAGYGSARRVVSSSIVVSANSSQITYTDLGVATREYSILWDILSNEDAEFMDNMQWNNLTSGDFLFCLEPYLAATRTMFARFAKIDPLSYSAYQGDGGHYYSHQTTLIESR